MFNYYYYYFEMVFIRYWILMMVETGTQIENFQLREMKGINQSYPKPYMFVKSTYAVLTLEFYRWLKIANTFSIMKLPFYTKKGKKKLKK